MYKCKVQFGMLATAYVGRRVLAIKERDWDAFFTTSTKQRLFSRRLDAGSGNEMYIIHIINF